jgi:hypothetical protein
MEALRQKVVAIVCVVIVLFSRVLMYVADMLMYSTLIFLQLRMNLSCLFRTKDP